MAVPQPVLMPPSRAALFLVVTVRPGAEAAVRDALQDVTGLARSVVFRAPADGLTCVVYARTPAVTERMLRNMFLGDPPGDTDRILGFSRAVTGGLFSVPSADLLGALPGAPDTGGLKGA
ncbi:hypothetical protein C5L38_04995 [Streptomyces sp. WAC00288]|nr:MULTISPECIES: Dyp-type peroxidase domain-containing protein [unclassified Streptomyces]AVH94488.1 hypothetical protein C5L38_04995 [Streptomyces sp. WAC00288]KYG53218.1 hypothetical protein AWI43_00955 [Streptomyces sp. WAC04657]